MAKNKLKRSIYSSLIEEHVDGTIVKHGINGVLWGRNNHIGESISIQIVG